MRKISVIMLCAALLAFVCAPVSLFAQKTARINNKETVKLYIKSMNCGNCVKKIEKNIAFEKGITDLKCDLKTQTVEVTYRSDKTTVENILKAFEKIEEPAKVLKPDEPVKPSGHEGYTH